MKWTLVQHSAWAYAGNPQFENAVEEVHVQGPAAEAKILRAGGIVYTDYMVASERAYEENYPPDVWGLCPGAKGTFARTKIDGQRVYIPPSED